MLDNIVCVRVFFLSFLGSARVAQRSFSSGEGDGGKLLGETHCLPAYSLSAQNLINLISGQLNRVIYKML